MSKIEEDMENSGNAREKEVDSGQAATAAKNEPCSSHPATVGHIQILNPRLVAVNDYNLPIAEEYRKLRSIVVQLSNQEQRHKTLMVTSSVGGEGKSITALNLALSLAQGYDHRVLLVDADLRNPSICRYLGLDRGPGLAECLLDDVNIDDVLIQTGLGSLLLLSAGREVANPVEILDSEKMTEFLVRIKQQFAGYYIIFDMSPVLPFAEARVIGSRVDGVIFVVKEGGTSCGNIRDSLEALKTSNILGVVFNKVSSAGLAGGYHYYYYEYNNRPRGAESSGKQSKTGLISRLFRRQVRL